MSDATAQAPAAPAPAKKPRKPKGEAGSVYVLCYEDGTYSSHDKDTVLRAVEKPEKGRKIKFMVRGVPSMPRVETVIRLGT